MDPHHQYSIKNSLLFTLVPAVVITAGDGVSVVAEKGSCCGGSAKSCVEAACSGRDDNGVCGAPDGANTKFVGIAVCLCDRAFEPANAEVIQSLIFAGQRVWDCDRRLVESDEEGGQRVAYGIGQFLHSFVVEEFAGDFLGKWGAEGNGVCWRGRNIVAVIQLGKSWVFTFIGQ